MDRWIETLRRLNVTLFVAGDTPVTAGTVLGLLLSVLALLVLARWLRSRLLARLLARTPLDPGSRQTVAALAYYVVLVIGLAAIMQNAGLKLSAFSLLAGAVGVGIGFGLQNIISNFVSGLIVMLERPVRIGDRIEIGGMEGDVVAINARSTVLRTNRGAAAIVPNQKFITELVRNWALPDGSTSLQLGFKLAREQDLGAAQAAILQLARELAPGALERGYGPRLYCTAVDAASCSFELQVWVNADAQARAHLHSELLVALSARLAQAGIRLL